MHININGSTQQGTIPLYYVAFFSLFLTHPLTICRICQRIVVTKTVHGRVVGVKNCKRFADVLSGWSLRSLRTCSLKYDLFTSSSLSYTGS